MVEAEDFLEELASSAPTPGGGAASAYCAALSSSLCSMVANLTIGKSRYADVEDEVIGCLTRLSILRTNLVALMEEDERAFGPLSDAYKMPSASEEEATARREAIQEALIYASDVPLKIMASVIDVLHECDFLARNGSVMALSDAGAAALMARAALLSASLNVYINASSMEDPSLQASYRQRADSLNKEGCELSRATYDHVASVICAPKEDEL